MGMPTKENPLGKDVYKNPVELLACVRASLANDLQNAEAQFQAAEEQFDAQERWLARARENLSKYDAFMAEKGIVLPVAG